ncbi:MAG: hypoxanthine phosphoribosyltransferase [Candidatus Caenarcaniphilales bacterium]|nr:hypoxanthine phosphoribosyltransferase [Candidatus Caenarcaniphilales bacterium]
MLETLKKEEIKVLFSEEDIAAKIKELGETISDDYKDTESLIIVGVLKGSFMFTADLVRQIKVPCQMEFIKLSSYEDGTESSGKIKAVDLSLPALEGKDVLIVEDIVDSGRTAKFLKDYFDNQVETETCKIAALFDKPSRRLAEFKDIQADYTGFVIDDHFIVGYGLDYAQKFRELPYVGCIELD